MRNNPNITIEELTHVIGLKKTSIQNYIRELQKEGIILRVGSRNNGYWKVTEHSQNI